jgi:hypothetical protein
VAAALIADGVDGVDGPPTMMMNGETGQTPIARFATQGPLQAIEPSLLREAFRWSIVRRVTSTASVSLAGNRYAVDPSLIGRRVELRFDPEDLTRLDVFWEGRPVGQAIPFIIGRHVQRQVPQPQPSIQTRPPASITWASSWPSMTTTCWARSPTATCRVLPRTSGHDPRSLGQPLRLQPHPIQQDHPRQPIVRSGQPPGSRRAHPLLHRRVAPGRHHWRGGRRQDR